ncbi:coiled-coil domain containing 53 [Oratosquilla oratoria]|uniref:coiled-coil domain containing 53 n=1 Tax=Oratosquilla oratoria TaxID=337810 RepID=UPI003F75C537
MDGTLALGTAGVNYENVEPISQKRTLAFVNTFVVHTVQFLNRFSALCEERLRGVDSRLTSLEDTLAIIEAKLSSVPGLEVVQASPPAASAVSQSTPEASSVSHPPTNNPDSSTTPGIGHDSTGSPEVKDAVDGTQPQTTNNQNGEAEEEEEAAAPSGMTVSKDPQYERFFKMVRMGVPVPAVKMKMTTEGLNPDLLDTPDALLPATSIETAEDSDSSVSSWSD